MNNKFGSLLSTTAALAVATFAAAPAMAQGQAEKPAGTVSQSTTVTATVTHVDQKDRWVTLKLDDGTTTEIQAGPEVKNFAQIKVGDKVTAKQEDTLALAVTAGGETAPTASSGSSVVTAPLGTKPMGVMVQTATVSGKVTAIDHANRTVTLLGPKGNSHTIEVSPDVTKFDAIKTGDIVTMTLKSASSIEVTAPAKGMKPAN